MIEITRRKFMQMIMVGTAGIKILSEEKPKLSEEDWLQIKKTMIEAAGYEYTGAKNVSGHVKNHYLELY